MIDIYTLARIMAPFILITFTLFLLITVECVRLRRNQLSMRFEIDIIHGLLPEPSDLSRCIDKDTNNLVDRIESETARNEVFKFNMGFCLTAVVLLVPLILGFLSVRDEKLYVSIFFIYLFVLFVMCILSEFMFRKRVRDILEAEKKNRLD